MITNFTFKELIKTDTGLDNMPNDMNIIKNLCRLTDFLQMIRNELQLLMLQMKISSIQHNKMNEVNNEK